MQFPVDPGRVKLDVFVWLVIAFLVVALPLAVLLQHRRRRDKPLPSRASIYGSTLLTHGVFVALVWGVAANQGLDFLPPYRPTLPHILIALGALALGLIPLFLDPGRTAGQAHERVRLIAPRTAGEHGVFYLLALSAGVAEELAYRGALFTFLGALTGSWWAAAIGASLAFGIVHLFQGWKGVTGATLIGLREQLVVGITGTLVLAIVVHAAHNAIAGTVVGLRARRDEREGALALP